MLGERHGAADELAAGLPVAEAVGLAEVVEVGLGVADGLEVGEALAPAWGLAEAEAEAEVQAGTRSAELTLLAALLPSSSRATGTITMPSATVMTKARAPHS